VCLAAQRIPIEMPLDMGLARVSAFMFLVRSRRDDPGVNLAGERGEELVLKDLVLTVFEEDALVFGALVNPARER
jgi:hypothetical protein